MFFNSAIASVALSILSGVSAAPAHVEVDDRSLVRDATPAKVFVGYWSVWAGQGKALPTKEHLTGLTHVILSFASNTTFVGPTAGVIGTGPEGFMPSDNNAWSSVTPQALRDIAGKPDLKVLAAIGGWALEEPFNVAVRGGQTDQFVANCVKYVDAYKLDGIDLDWEYPVNGGEFDTTDHPGDIEGFEILLKKLRAALPQGKLLTVAIGSKEEGLKGFTATSVPKYDQYVDFWNVMSYDYANRRDLKTGFHASNSVMEMVVADLEKRNFKTSKLVLGYPMYAKWFQLTPAQATACPATKSIGCAMGPYEGAGALLSGFWMWNTALNVPPSIGREHTPASRLGSASAGNITDWNAFDDKTALGSATVDTVNNVYWTWMSPYDMGQTCAKWHQKTAGTMYWSMLEDSGVLAGGPHVQALQKCVAGG